MTYPTAMAEARIDLDRLVQNIRLVKKNIPKHIKILFAVKRDAYGHGLIEISKTAEQEGIDYLGVAEVEEIRQLRYAGIKLPTFILGPTKREYIAELIDLNAQIVVSDIDFAAEVNLQAQKKQTKAFIQIVIDTGLGRDGIFPVQAVPFFKELHKLNNLKIDGVYTHLSVADSTNPDDKEFTLLQIKRLNKVLEELDREGLLPPLRHIGNSPCLINYASETMSGYFNLVRIGSIFYGYPESPEVKGSWAEEILPIATVVTTIIDIRDVPPDWYISYGRTYKTNLPCKVAVLPIGYGSGLHRGLSNRGEVLIKGKRVAIIGKICMDHTMVNVTNINAQVGDEVEIISPRLTAFEQGKNIGVGYGDILTPLLKGVKKCWIFSSKTVW